MKLALFATAAIASAALLIPYSLADSAKGQDCMREGGFSTCLSQKRDGDIWEGYKQREERGSRYYDDINRIYRQVLGREADYRGLRTWSRELERGRSIRDIRRELANSNEAENAINQIYREVLGRNVDREGLRTWTRQLANGRSLREVRRSIERSTEARTGG